MKIKKILLFALLLLGLYSYGQVGIGTETPFERAMLDVKAKDKGVLIPAMTTADRDAIQPLKNGLTVFNVDELCYNYYRNPATGWLSLCGAYPPAEVIITDDQCSLKELKGIYREEGTLSPTDHYIAVEVTVTRPGTYEMFAEALTPSVDEDGNPAGFKSNGYNFRASGTFPQEGTYTVVLRGEGKPKQGHSDPEVMDGAVIEVNGKATTCTVQIPVLPGDVDYKLDCTDPSVKGKYMVAIDLDSETNVIELPVNVKSVGAWEITANTVNGYTFKGEGVFSALGDQVITLEGSGAPIEYTGVTGDLFTLSTNSMTSNSCQVYVMIEPVSYTMDGVNATVNGYYEVNSPLDDTHYITLPIDVLATGTTTITTETKNGMTFSSGEINLTTLGEQNVTLYPTLPASPADPYGDNIAFETNGDGATASTNISISIAREPVKYTLDCTTAEIVGKYFLGVESTSTENALVIEADVQATGDYDITTETINGVTFSGTGTFAAKGTNTITLYASGVPLAGGEFEFTVDAGENVGVCSGIPVTMGYRSPNILYYGIGMYGGADGARILTFLRNETNFGINGAIPVNGGLNVIAKPSGYYPTAAQLKQEINDSKADIVIVGYWWQYSEEIAVVLEDFIKNKKGYVIEYVQTEGSSARLFSKLGITYTRMHTFVNVDAFMPIVNTDNPITSGPFTTGTGSFNKDIKGGIWYNDGHDTRALTNPVGDITVITTGTSFSAPIEEVVSSFIHNSLGFAWQGDGGWLAGNNSTEGPGHPFSTTVDGLVVDKIVTGRETYNSRYFGNLISHAIKYINENTDVDYEVK